MASTTRSFEPTSSNAGTGKGLGQLVSECRLRALRRLYRDEAVTVGGADIYWYDDGGGLQVPVQAAHAVPRCQRRVAGCQHHHPVREQHCKRTNTTALNSTALPPPACACMLPFAPAQLQRHLSLQGLFLR